MVDETDDAAFEALLTFLNGSRGVDFSGYKRPTLRRRILRRMQVVSIAGFERYRDHMEAHPEEFGELFNTVLINVTGFFRDKGAWELLGQQLLPALLARKPPGESVRVWSAGCASGEEAYSVAILLAEALGTEALQERVKIYATDVDEDALRTARLATYTLKDLESVPLVLREKYFEASNGRYTFRPDLRRTLIIGNHNLHHDAPISRLDLLVCRNTLMYFNAEAQSKILGRFHFALNDTGLLFLGKAELLLTQPALFTAVAMRHRIFAKSTAAIPPERLLPMAETHAGSPQLLRDAAFHCSPLAQMVVDASGRLEAANEGARMLFGLTAKDLGRPFQELELSSRPIELRSRLEQVYHDRRPVTLPDVERHLSSGEVQHLDVHLVPLQESASRLLGVSIAFVDVTARERLLSEQRTKS